MKLEIPIGTGSWRVVMPGEECGHCPENLKAGKGWSGGGGGVRGGGWGQDQMLRKLIPAVQ